ncbi:DNA topoisomerase I [Desulfofarcimen acetoxidans DSM 771]|uniref:DNA topoisomerase 1 n=1 Tax=Desulfofarcimen acetoxidans (strain ATCC 49208 / DSM 771 / KCTC 5769 / VKM B-1644 / 5575) TaxID=485916 RepID=C8W5C5_DESAS|nr:type I DNA topoisomerase [Desulfofarcimen acetoxidans]ACV62107.1 DNA topoisomerase I [Desulfofarcimen acetoxidans DSM 771]
MSTTLVIVESPAKAKSIGKFLGKKYTVKASMGHVRDLPKSQFGVDVEAGFMPKYITIRGKGDTIKELRSAVKKADTVLLASDPDREGEAIAWHLQKLLKIEDNQPCRIEFNEITKQAIQNAVTHPRKIDYNRVNAQQARRILDRLVGYNLSPLLWRKVRKGLSAGRVQSVAVRLICEREEEIDSFEQVEYWTLTGKFLKAKAGFEGKLLKYRGEKLEVSDEESMQKILQALEGSSYVIEKVSRRERSRRPAAPFTTSSMQQEAYRKLNFTARKTMVVAQQLYEGLDLGKEGSTGLVTYIRTDSTRVSGTAKEEAKEYIDKQFGQAYTGEQDGEIKGQKERKIQDAHEAIRPTSVFREPDQVKKFLTPEQYKLYRLIWSRFVASQMSPAIIDTTSVDIAAGEYTFRSAGSIVKFSGFMKVYTEGNDDGQKEEIKTLPELAEGEKLELTELLPKQHFTQPPPRYTDASLIKLLEENGIGRPSTYAPIVETIQKRGYVSRENKQFFPTELGFVVVEMLKEHFPEIIDVEFTADMEKKLDHIEEGDTDWIKILEEFYGPFHETMEKAEEAIGKIELQDEVTEEICELCGRNMVIKFGRFGKFLACPGFPDCRNTKPLLEPTGVTCPLCSGEVVLRRTKKGRKFYGCSRYPECDFVTWDLPTNEKCPSCNSMMVKKSSKNKQMLSCVNQECKLKIEMSEDKK